MQEMVGALYRRCNDGGFIKQLDNNPGDGGGSIQISYLRSSFILSSPSIAY